MHEDFFKPRLTFSCNYHFQMKITLTLLFSSFDKIKRICFPTLASVSSHFYSFTCVSFCQTTHCLSCPPAVPEVTPQRLLFWEISFGLPWWHALYQTFHLLSGDFFFLKIKLILFIYSSLAVLALHCCMGFSLVAASGDCSRVAVWGLCIAAASCCRAWLLRHVGSVAVAPEF